MERYVCYKQYHTIYIFKAGMTRISEPGCLCLWGIFKPFLSQQVG